MLISQVNREGVQGEIWTVTEPDAGKQGMVYHVQAVVCLPETALVQINKVRVQFEGLPAQSPLVKGQQYTGVDRKFSG